MTAAMHGAQVFHLPVTPVEYPPIPHASCEAREDGESGHHRRISELEAQVAELDAYTAAVAHDLRAPLRSIHGYADILTEDHGRELTGDARACVSKIIAAAHEMGRVIDDLLALSQTGAQPITMSIVNTGEQVRGTLIDLLPYPEARIQLKVGELLNCWGSTGLLRQVWTNLLSNALKFTREREPAVIEIGSSCSGTDGIVTYFVRDNGAGFDAERAKNLFVPFRRYHDARQYEGNGVGLAIAQRIIRRHGGRLWAESRPGKGATFYFSLCVA